MSAASRPGQAPSFQPNSELYCYLKLLPCCWPSPGWSCKGCLEIQAPAIKSTTTQPRSCMTPVTGVHVQVGNFRVEPPGLFRGRGEHPRMGMLKKRIYPKDITINIGRGEPVPEHPYTGQKWKEIRHDNTVTWLAFWKDTISEKVGPRLSSGCRVQGVRSCWGSKGGLNCFCLALVCFV